MTRVTLDARGLRCPWPALRLAREMRGDAAEILIAADDPQAAAEIGALCEEKAWSLTRDGDHFLAVRRRRAEP